MRGSGQIVNNGTLPRFCRSWRNGNALFERQGKSITGRGPRTWHQKEKPVFIGIVALFHHSTHLKTFMQVRNRRARGQCTRHTCSTPSASVNQSCHRRVIVQQRRPRSAWGSVQWDSSRARDMTDPRPAWSAQQTTSAAPAVQSLDRSTVFSQSASTQSTPTVAADAAK